MELIEGKWYKNLGEKKDHIGKFDGWYNLNIISVSEYIYKGELHGYSKCFTEAYKFAKECPLSEIQQYLPDGHPDKEFVLPEKWCVLRDTKEKGEILSEWANKDSGTSSHVGWKDGNYIHSDNIDESLTPRSGVKALGYTEITLEQFKKYVLKQEDMDKEIIGYKLKEDCEKYIPALDEVCKCFSFGNHMFDIGSVYYEAFEEAGVLNLWFEPIFKEKFKVGDWVMETWASSPYYNLKAFRIIRINNEIAIYDRQGECKITLSNLRLATSEEIKKTLVEEAVKRGFKGGVKIDKTPLNYSGTAVWTLGSSSSGFIYEPSRDELQWSASQDIVYRNGKWAEILPSYPQIEINGYKGEFFDNYVKFGCAEIHKNIFIDLNTLNKDLVNGDGVIGMKSNRQIESITIGKGTFSKEQIKLIADHYLNKK